ncbi:hypothetical protein F4703DRAFT_1928220 [Phycomyces blakesleeanus]|uniref:J domain-containing protein n=1 Tax=Phycomyces blakesleeanus (strain ATCC 8743b / DSM 1359 / FGSC 10004 / NBRC 33097 / NRRL 1555) TaxID=763407 RepID=A0A167N8K7_PHYB8|nr:hypothetical protein PHYBLDRAFT_143585 [Phycomyces blakesleeanus NRRL 1555(-)]OAD75330.1 hypothetical protein PHYBLDRAFT_143585 [Phycomyces blakesleeanus NRRL 1555(-)]|eukprot:XP_018293370.1 hypothetical protein PHYBLDRAFT_143585 [Phycomyces blakesleeanus NRRL 1555(-)]
MPFINPLPVPPVFQVKDPAVHGDEERYRCVEQILSAPDCYRVLGVTREANPDDIRRAYIKKSRICHPDKFVPAYPRATESFQLLSRAYETLSNPSAKLMYDLSKQKGPSTFVSTEDEHANDTLQRVLHQLFIEMMDGEFQTLRAFIHALNETNPGMHITTHQYYKVVQFELMRLYELQHELRSLSYFSVWRRMQLSITICKVLLQLPIMINVESREKKQSQRQLGQADAEAIHGILGLRLESALRLAVTLLETGERYVTAW